jgi:thioesterase domain-containing protein
MRVIASRVGETDAAPAPVFLITEADRALPVGRRLPLEVLRFPELSAATSIEELAANCLRAIYGIQPFGPYRLLGNSLGGLVAYELATQLLGRDERVDFFGMIDCRRPRNLPPDRSGEQESLAVKERYCPQPLPIPIYYFVAEAHPDPEATRAWRSLAGDSLRVVTFATELTDDVLAEAIAKAPKQQFLQRAAEQEAGYCPLVTVNIGAMRHVPVIFAPGAGGSVTSGMSLAESLHSWATVHGLQPRGFHAVSVPHSTVQAAVAVYMRSIRHVQPRGPYRFVGHSFGGWVVFELACRLAAEGESVDPIVLLDTEAPMLASRAHRHHGRVEILTRLVRALEEFAEQSMNLRSDELRALDYEAQLSRLARGMKRLGLLPPSCDANEVRGLVRVFEANLNTKYTPALRFPGAAVLFQATERSCAIEREEEWGPAATCEAWRSHVDQLECVSVAGKHMTMLKQPNVAVIAGHVSRLWNGSGSAGKVPPEAP